MRAGLVPGMCHGERSVPQQAPGCIPPPRAPLRMTPKQEVRGTSKEKPSKTTQSPGQELNPHPPPEKPVGQGGHRAGDPHR